MNWLKKYWKATLFVTLLIALLVIAVLGWHWTETATKPFWWTFWIVAALVALVAFIGLIKWFGSSKKKW